MAELKIPALETINITPMSIVAEDDTSTDPLSLEVLYHNTTPVKIGNDKWAITTRPTFVATGTDNSSATRHGRSLFEWGSALSYGIYQTYYYNNGASSASMWAGNNYSLNKEGAYTLYSQGGNDRLIIQNAGDHSAADSGNAYYQETPTSAPVRITDADMPGNTGVAAVGAVHLNGYLYIGKITGEIHNSDLDDCTAWGATSFISAERSADPLMYLGKQRDHVVAIGQTSIEFFYDAGLTNGSPLQRRQDIFHNFNVFHQSLIHELGDVIYMMGWTPDGDAGLYKLENFQLTKVSSPMFDYITNQIPFSLLEYDEENGTSMWGKLINVQKSGLCWVYTNGGFGAKLRGTFVLHLETGIVSKWYTGSNPTNDGGLADWDTAELLPIMSSVVRPAYTHNTSKNTVLFGNGETAIVDEAGYGNMDDLSLDTPDCFYYTLPVDMDTNKRKRIFSTRVLHYPSIDDTLDPATLTVNWVDTRDLQTAGWADTLWTGTRTVDLSTADAEFTRCGVTRQRVFKVALTPGKKQLIKGLELDYDVLRR